MRACDGRDDEMKDQEIEFLLPANISSRKHDWGIRLTAREALCKQQKNEISFSGVFCAHERCSLCLFFSLSYNQW